MAVLITAVGTRRPTATQEGHMYMVCLHLFLFGCTMRTGDAIGTDESVIRAHLSLCDHGRVEKNQIEIYKPAPGSKSFIDPFEQNVHSITDDEYMTCAEVLRTTKVCTYFDRLPPFTRKLFARNVLQVKGREGILSNGLIFSANETSKGVVSGGTRIAVDLARHYDIPTLNTKTNRTTGNIDIFKTLGVL